MPGSYEIINFRGMMRCWVFTTILWLSSYCLFSQDNACRTFTITDFLYPCEELELKVNEAFNLLSEEEKVGQMIVPAAGHFGKDPKYVAKLVRQKKVGGVILLTGTRNEFKKSTTIFDSINNIGKGVPLMFSADAELSLINMKIKGTTPVKKAFRIKSESELTEETNKICNELMFMGIHQNFAPVADMSPNATVSLRSFGNHPDTIVKYCNKFVQVSTENNILTCAKHFPGHGNVVGDTHKQLVYIKGEMKEVELYKPLISQNIPSIMVGHIAVSDNEKYNTNDLPSTCSRTIVTDLLRNEMGFKGLIVTDALNMGGVINVPDCGLKAAKAGCDILLMPVDENKAINSILKEMKTDQDFRDQVYQSVKRIIRLKICMGIIE